MSTRADSITFEDEKGGMLSAPVHSDSVEKMLRIGFVKKVYGILTAQLFLTFGMIFVFVFVEPVKVQLCGMSSIDACTDCPPYVDDKVVLQIDEATDPEKQSCMWLQPMGGRTGQPTGEVPGGKCNLSRAAASARRPRWSRR